MAARDSKLESGRLNPEDGSEFFNIGLFVPGMYMHLVLAVAAVVQAEAACLHQARNI